MKNMLMLAVSMFKPILFSFLKSWHAVMDDPPTRTLARAKMAGGGYMSTIPPLTGVLLSEIPPFPAKKENLEGL